jgi:restriction endonuclease S subunit
MTDELPQGWTPASIRDVVENLQPGFASGEKNVAGGLAHLRMNNIGVAGELVMDLIRKVPQNLARPQHDLQRGDVLICMTNSSDLVGKCAYFDLPGKYVFSNHLTRLRPKAGVIDGKFLRWNLWLQWRRGVFHDKCKHWVNQSALPKDALLSTEVALSPFNEQRRIVAKLEILLGKVDDCQRRLAKIPVLLKRFRQSVLAAACSGRLTAEWREQNSNVESMRATIEKLKARLTGAKVRRGVPERVPQTDMVADWELPSTWGRYSTAELLRCGAFVDVKDGNHGANHPKVSEFTETGLPFITATQVNNYRIDYNSAYKLSGKPLDRIRVGFAKSGDVIYTHKGSVGRVAVADRDCILSPQTTYYRVNPEVFASSFVMFYLASQAFSEQVNVVKEQTTRDFVPISEQYCLFHRVPPLPEQREIARRVESLFALADHIEARYAKAKAHVEKLTQSILAKAFRGELVPQDLNDEPASVLLERIRQLRDRNPDRQNGKDAE